MGSPKRGGISLVASSDRAEPTPAKRSPPARIKIRQNDQVSEIAADHPDPAEGYALLMQAVGTDDPDFMAGFIGQIVNAGTRGPQADEAATNFLFSVVKGIGPRDQVEAMLGAQMAAVHTATMTFARRLNHVDNLAQQDSAERTFNKLARTFTTQVEALKRYRSRGEQTVRVEHVTVNEGGQAIVGNVSGEGRGDSKT